MRKTKNNYVPAEYGGYMFPKSCLPDILPGDRGKVLTVNQNETDAIWATAGGSNNMLVHVSMEYDDQSDSYIAGIVDKTWKEIRDAFLAGVRVLFLYIDENEDYNFIAQCILQEIGYNEDDGYFIVLDSTLRSSTYFVTDSENGYPSFAPIGG